MSQPSKWSIVSRGDNPRVISPFKNREEAVAYYESRGNLNGLPVAFVETEAPVVADVAPAAAPVEIKNAGK